MKLCTQFRARDVIPLTTEFASNWPICCEVSMHFNMDPELNFHQQTNILKCFNFYSTWFLLLLVNKLWFWIIKNHIIFNQDADHSTLPTGRDEVCNIKKRAVLPKQNPKLHSTPTSTAEGRKRYSAIQWLLVIVEEIFNKQKTGQTQPQHLQRSNCSMLTAEKLINTTVVVCSMAMTEQPEWLVFPQDTCQPIHCLITPHKHINIMGLQESKTMIHKRRYNNDTQMTLLLVSVIWDGHIQIHVLWLLIINQIKLHTDTLCQAFLCTQYLFPLICARLNWNHNFILSPVYREETSHSTCFVHYIWSFCGQWSL